MYTPAWDVENRLSAVTNTVTLSVTRFYYDGDGKRVKKVESKSATSTTTVYVGAHYEKNVTTGVTTTYYYAGAMRVAMRQGGAVYYLHADHLGSASLTTDANGNRYGELRFKPYGETRYIWGATPTDRRFTGQRSEEVSLGSLYDYNARFYSPYLNRFLSADSIVPGAADGVIGYNSKTRLTPLTVNLGEFAAQIGEENREIGQYGWFFQWDGEVRQKHNVPMGPTDPQTLNRYSYCLNNPSRYADPTGHLIVIPMAAVFVGVGILAVGAMGAYYYGAVPNAAQNRAALAAGFSQLAEGAQNRVNEAIAPYTTLIALVPAVAQASINIAFAKKSDIKWVDYLQKKYGLSKDQREWLHQQMRQHGLTSEEIEAEAEEIARRNQEKSDEHDK